MKTVSVILVKKTAGQPDPFGQATYTTEEIQVDGVLVGEPSTNDITNAMTMHGAKLAYTLAIPKGDTNDWTDTIVKLTGPFAGTYHTVGIGTAGIEENIPLRWNRKVHLERYEG